MPHGDGLQLPTAAPGTGGGLPCGPGIGGCAVPAAVGHGLSRSLPRRTRGNHSLRRSNDDGADGTMPLEIDASLRDLLAPLVAERVRQNGGIAPPHAFQVEGAFAAVSTVTAANSESRAGSVGTERGSHFAGACRSLAMHGFRRCSLVVDKLGLSITCVPEEPGGQTEQVDFPWSSISDVQDPRTKSGLQACAVTLGIREPSKLFQAPTSALALVLRLPDRETAQRLADAGLAFKAYEAQAALWYACGRAVVTAPLIGATAALLLDERGCAFWSVAGDVDASNAEIVPTVPADIGPVMEGSTSPTHCCNLCWC
eukprot:TRINITY_DN18003_c0_g1_i1.p1 TRINITY_DN18003_c0_g1~~TRINITY_DN18003_c0_g1_i1.p1  ORF type:complete len:357 (-),score=54.70 TRINITY_DN18003_c0_g1_i1:321-1259(-)